MHQLRFHRAVRFSVIFCVASWVAGCRDEAKPPAAGNEPNVDQIAADIHAAVESAREGGSSTVVSGPDGKVAASFAMPGVKDVSIGISTSSNAGKSSASITVTFNNAEPVVLTPAAFAAIKPGMDYAQIAQAVGGELTKGRLGDHYTGEFVIAQASRRINLTFKDGKIDDKKSTGIEPR